LAVSKGDEELLLQNLDSLYIYEEADSNSGNRQLYRFVLKKYCALRGFLAAQFWAVFLCAVRWQKFDTSTMAS